MAKDHLPTMAGSVASFAMNLMNSSYRTRPSIRYLILVLGLIGNGVLIGGCSNVPEVVQRNQLLISQGRTGEAIADYRQRTVENPETAEWHYQLAAVYYQIGELDDARASITRALLLNPLVDRYRLLAGKISYMAHHHFDAINHLTSALIINAQLLEGYYYLALAYHQTEKTDEALRQLEAAIAIEPLYFDAHLAWTKIKFQQLIRQESGQVDQKSTAESGITTITRDYSQLIAALEKALTIQPVSVEGHLLLSEIYYAVGAEYKARVILESWLERFTQDDRILQALAKIQYQAGRYEAALATLQRRHESDLKSKILELRIRHRQAAAEELILEAEQLAQQYPKSESLLVLLGQLELERLNTSAAERYLQQALSLDPRYAEAYFFLSRVYREENDFTGARWALRRSLSLGPENHQVKIHYLKGLIEDERWQEAGDFLKNYYLDPTNPDVIFLKGVIAKEKGDFHQAEQLFLSAQRREYSVKVEVQLADMEIRQGKYHSAEIRLTRIGAFFPGNLEIDLTHARLLFQQQRSADILPLLKPHLSDRNGKGKVHLAIAEAMVQTGAMEEALELLADGIKRWTWHPDLVEVYTFHLGLAERYDTAIRLLEDMQTFRHKYNRLFYFRLREFYYRAGRFEDFRSFPYRYQLVPEDSVNRLLP
jgi:tetratricopeptide (TPR) repeat protein